MILVAIMLIGVALLNQSADCHSLASNYKSLDEFARSQNNQGLDTDQVRQLLLRANPEDTIGEATVKELLKLDDIKIYHCNMVGLDICGKVEHDKDLAPFCQNRQNELAKFCVERLDEVIEADLRNYLGKKSKRGGLQRDIDDAAEYMIHKSLNNVREEFKKYVLIPFSYNKQNCLDLFRSMKSAEAIMERRGEKFVDLARHNDSLFDLFILYELCLASKEKNPNQYESLEKDLG